MTDNMQRARELLLERYLSRGHTDESAELRVRHIERHEPAAMQAIAAALRLAVPEWRPIETAPKDGSGFLAFWETNTRLDDRSYGVVVFHRGEWCSPDNYSDTYGDPTHWMPLPAAPRHEPGEVERG